MRSILRLGGRQIFQWCLFDDCMVLSINIVLQRIVITIIIITKELHEEGEALYCDAWPWSMPSGHERRIENFKSVKVCAGTGGSARSFSVFSIKPSMRQVTMGFCWVGGYFTIGKPNTLPVHHFQYYRKFPLTTSKLQKTTKIQLQW